jgi:hypothetical protein
MTLLESWNANWTWVSPNILLSFALIRLARPYVHSLAQRHGWLAFFLFVAALICLLPFTGSLVDYGAEGWLWALFGLYQRIHIDSAPRARESGATPADAMRFLACFAAAVAYVWREQAEFLFTQPQFNTFMLGICALSICLCLFRRGPSLVRPPRILVQPLRLIGRHTLLLYALQLGGSEIAVGLYPDLAP